MYAFYMAIMFFIKFIVMDNIDAPLEILDLLGMIISEILDMLLGYGMFKLMTRLFGNKLTRSADFKPE